MKWLAGGLTFVNISTVCGLLFGMIGHGTSRPLAMLALTCGVVAGVLAAWWTNDPDQPEKGATPIELPPMLSKRARKKRGVRDDSIKEPVMTDLGRWCFWILAAIFAGFALRSFCWLLYLDGDKLRIQSPNNLGDLSLHLTYIRYLGSGIRLWPDNPILVGSHLRYPAGVDLFNGLLSAVHFDLIRGLVWTGLLASLAAFYALYRWGGSFTVAGFLFNGGIAGFLFVKSHEFLDYQGVPTIAWKSIPLSMFVPQRGMLYAIPAGLLLLCHWRKVIPSEGPSGLVGTTKRILSFWVELSLYAFMPLFHVHTFLSLSALLGFWLLLGNRAARVHVSWLIGCAVIPATFLVSLITDGFRARSVMQWKPGWVESIGDFAHPLGLDVQVNLATLTGFFGVLHRVAHFFQFWFINFGITIPLVLTLLVLLVVRHLKKDNLPDRSLISSPLAFVVPGVAIFLIACLVKTAPWEWDNMKLLIWAYLIVLPFLWTDLIAKWPLPVRTGLCSVLFFSGFVSLFGGLAVGSPGFEIATRSQVDGVADAVAKLPIEARFAAYPTYNHLLLLNGRKVVAGYPGHLWTQGFDYTEVENKLKLVMSGAPGWRDTARDLGARYLFWGNEEKANYRVSSRPWERSTLLVASGEWGAIYDLEQPFAAAAH